MSGELEKRLPTIRPSEVRVTTTVDGKVTTETARLVHPRGVALPMYIIEVDGKEVLLTLDETIEWERRAGMRPDGEG